MIPLVCGESIQYDSLAAHTLNGNYYTLGIVYVKWNEVKEDHEWDACREEENTKVNEKKEKARESKVIRF